MSDIDKSVRTNVARAIAAAFTERLTQNYHPFQTVLTPEAAECLADAAFEAMRDWPGLEYAIDALVNAPVKSGYGKKFWSSAIDAITLPNTQKEGT